MTTDEYLYDTEQTNRRRELAAGVLREPPAPFYSHQRLTLRIARVLADHVEPRRLGKVAVAPVDVVLDRERALILQPDVLFIARHRLAIVDDQVWGAPDLVVEILSSGTAAYDRGEKYGWYLQYGVREYWIVDPMAQEVVVADFTAAQSERRVYRDTDTIRSSVLPWFTASAAALFL
jgi:Uma2 family endonuclease